MSNVGDLIRILASNSTEEFQKDDPVEEGLMQQILFIAHGYVLFPVLLLGACGNIMSFVVFLKCRKRNDANVQYLSWLAVSDTCCIVILGIQGLERGLQIIGEEWNLKIMMYSSVTCKMYHYLMFVFSNISAWLVAIFSAERALVVMFPFKRAEITEKKRNMVIFVILILSSTLTIYKPLLVDIEHFSGTAVCYYLGQTLALVLHMVDACVNIYFPALTMFVANSFIIYGLFRARRVKTEISSTSDRQDRRTSVNLIALSTLYIGLMLPREFCWTYFEIIKYRKVEYSYVQSSLQLASFFDSISALNYSVNFVIYGVSLPFYRRAFRSVLCCNVMHVRHP